MCFFEFLILILHVWAQPRRFLNVHLTHGGLESLPLEPLWREAFWPLRHDGKQCLSFSNLCFTQTLFQTDP